jgi:hypothetical protein
MTNQNPTQLCLGLQAREGGGAEAGDGGPGRGRAAAGTQPGGTPGQVRRLGLCRRRRRSRVITAGAGGCAGPACGASLDPRRGRQLLGFTCHTIAPVPSCPAAARAQGRPSAAAAAVAAAAARPGRGRSWRMWGMHLKSSCGLQKSCRRRWCQVWPVAAHNALLLCAAAAVCARLLVQRLLLALPGNCCARPAPSTG